MGFQKWLYLCIHNNKTRLINRVFCMYKQNHMAMNIQENWLTIKRHFYTCLKQNLHVAVASVSKEGYPTVTPIGSLFLNQDTSGFYFEKFPSKLPKHAKNNKHICVLAVNNSKWMWFCSLWKGKFLTFPGMKLYGELGKLRKATELEKQRWLKRTKIVKRLKGHDLLWSDMDYVREVHFTKAEIINLGKMTIDLG